MQLKKYFRYVAIAGLAMLPLIAAEYRGQVKFGGLPLPGATVTATQSDKKMTAVSDERGLSIFRSSGRDMAASGRYAGFYAGEASDYPGNGAAGPFF